MKKEDHILPPVLIEVKASLMLPGQIGLFAARDLEKDTIIADATKLGERFVSWTDLDKIDPITREKVEPYCLDTEEGFFVPVDFNYLSTPWNMNHSCNYNVGFDDVGNFVTARSVQRGEELMWDYGMGRSNPKFRLECACGSENCRKTITGSDWKDQTYVEKNKKYFLRELLSKPS
jgi:uncharacterized protein